MIKPTWLSGLFCLLVVSGCLQEQDDYFEQSASARLTSYLLAAQELLVSAPDGWVMPNYYADGGITLCVRFTMDSVYVLRAGSTLFQGSVYKMSRQSGPVLSFDSYLSSLHTYATPSSFYYQGRGEDFEFLITSMDASCISLQGLKWRQPSWLYPLAETATDYMAAVASMSQRIPKTTFEGVVDGQEVRLVLHDDGFVTRMLSVSVEGEALPAIPFTYSDKGLFLFEPISAGAVQIPSLTWSDELQTLDGEGFRFLQVEE